MPTDPAEPMPVDPPEPVPAGAPQAPPTEAAADTPEQRPEPGGEPSTAAEEGTISAGEGGSATDGPRNGIAAPKPASEQVMRAEVIIGKIPDAHDLSTILWTARCSLPSHDLLGHFDTREEAEQASAEHVQQAH
jgi:hypothetical protein